VCSNVGDSRAILASLREREEVKALEDLSLNESSEI
jgi:hypothetical protein